MTASSLTRSAGRDVDDASALNLGCGQDWRADAWNVDISRDVDADQYVDLQATPWPWADDAFDAIAARHVLEHLDPVPWGELQRVLSPGGQLVVEYPIGHTRFEDGSHEQFWTVHTAEWLAGERKHQHEAPLGDCRLVDRRVEWHADSLLTHTWARWRLLRHGVGPWLGQMTGVYGHVTATYRREGEQ